jgi:beta-lactamase class A
MLDRPIRAATTSHLRRCLTALCAAAAGWALPCGAAAPTAQLQSELAAIPLKRGVELGVHVLDLTSGAALDHGSTQRWYLASLVKLPIAIAVLRGVERGSFTLDTTLRLRADDRVDGAGQTNQQPIATELPLRYLLEQMMAYSDNTASDMLIDLVGLATVNETVASLVPQGFGPITSLADVRRKVYGELTPGASQLRGNDLLRLHAQPGDEARLQLLAQLVGEPATRFRRGSLQSAYAAYYRSGLNSATLDAYGQLVASVAQGRALGPEQTAYLLALMERTRTGTRRIAAGLAPELRWAHKTGTQRHRICDAGVVRAPGVQASAGTVVVACVRGDAPPAQAETALRRVGLALCRSGLISKGSLDATNCPAAPPVGRDADADGAPVVRGGTLRE